MRKFKSAFIAWVLLGTAFLTLLAFGLGPAVGTAPTRAGIDDPFDVYITFTNGRTYYPGGENMFYVNVDNGYDGSEYVGTGDPGNTSTVKEVQIHFEGVLTEDGEEIVNSPLVWEEDLDGFYNNDGDGYEIANPGSNNFYADASNNRLKFTIKTDNVFIGDFVMKFRVDFRYMIDWDGGTQYDWAWSSVMVESEHKVRSYIWGDGYPDYTFYAFEEDLDTDDTYSGATHKNFGLKNTYSLSGTLTDIEATISFPGSPIAVDDPLFTSESMQSKFLWRVTIPKDLAAGDHDVLLQISYTRNGDRIVESATLYEFTVEYTPLVMVPEFNDLNAPYATFLQNNMPDSLEFPVTNEGNVDLTEVVFSLDTDSTKYVGSGMLWYDENSNANPRYESQEFVIPALAVGESSTVTFEMVNFLPRLPPGLYKIPLDYLAKYEDTGATGNTPGEEVAGYWNEKGHYEHRNILRQISYPEDNGGDHMPYLLIEILPDPAGPNIDGYIDYGQNQYPGTANAYMRLRLDNYEMYSFYNLVYKIHTDEGSPLALPYSVGDENMTTLPPLYRAGLSGSTSTSTQSDYFYFYAKIRDDAVPGINYFKVDMEGFDQNLNPVSLTFTAYLQVRARQPAFKLLNIEVGDILDDRSVEVTAQIQNMGRGGASNLSCFFISSSTGFVATDPPQKIGTVGPDDTFYYSFHFKPDGERRYFNSNYYGNVYFAYYDDVGTYDEMFSGSSLYIRFDIYNKLPDMRIIKVDAPVVDRRQTFDVEITLMNVGGSTASNVKTRIFFNSALFEVLTGEVEIGDLEPGEITTITLSIKAGNEIYDGSTYSFTLYFSYTDIQGRTRTYSEAETESFSIRTKDRIIPSEQIQVVKDDGQIISEGAGSVILGIFIVIAVMVFVKLTSARQVDKVSEVSKAKDKDVKRTNKIEIEEDDEEEGSEDEEDEEEEDIEGEGDDAWT